MARKCVRRKRVRLKSGKTALRCASFSGGKKRKASKRKRKASKRKSTACKITTIGGRRRRVCRNKKGQITSNTKVRRRRKR